MQPSWEPQNTNRFRLLYSLTRLVCRAISDFHGANRRENPSLRDAGWNTMLIPLQENDGTELQIMQLSHAFSLRKVMHEAALYCGDLGFVANSYRSAMPRAQWR